MSDALEELKQEIVEAILVQMSVHPDQPDIRAFIDQPHDKLYGYHRTLGRDIRDTYNLWGHQLLNAEYVHPDDFSMEVIKALHIRAVQEFRRTIFSIR